MRINEILEQAQPDFQKRLKGILGRLLQADPNLMKFRMGFHVLVAKTHLSANARPNYKTGGCNITFDHGQSNYTDDALAWILAHELAHCVLGHFAIFDYSEKTRGMTVSQQIDWQRKNPVLSQKPDYSISNQRNFENEADVYAARLAVKAGYNPRNMLMGLTHEPVRPNDADYTHGTKQQRIDVIKQQTGIPISQLDPETLQHIKNGLAGINDPKQGNIFA